jgi:hypothetical protein
MATENPTLLCKRLAQALTAFLASSLLTLLLAEVLR